MFVIVIHLNRGVKFISLKYFKENFIELKHIPLRILYR